MLVTEHPSKEDQLADMGVLHLSMFSSFLTQEMELAFAIKNNHSNHLLSERQTMGPKKMDVCCKVLGLKTKALAGEGTVEAIAGCF